MKKKILSVILFLAVLMTTLAPGASAATLEADDGKEAAAMATVATAISDLKNVIPSDDLDTVMSIFSKVKSVGGVITSFTGPVNGTMAFLKLVGLVEDGNATKMANILNQLKTINERLAEMDGKLDNITEQMHAIQASAEFNTRTEKAMMLRSSWRTFKTNYMENSLDKYITNYKAMLLNGMQEWCQNKSAAARNDGTVDNSSLTLFYLPGENGVYELQFTAKNGIPASFPAEGRTLTLSAEMLPQNVSWDVNTYREDIASAIAANIRSAVQAGDYDALPSTNYPAFTAAGSAALNDQLIQRTAQEAVDVLSYRIASLQVNKDANFALEVNRLFTNYCTHLLSAEEGLDAIIKSFYLTHAFEYQITDDFNNFCNEMKLTTGTYGAFAMNIIGLSNSISDSEKESARAKYHETILSIDQAQVNGLTKNKNYCYVTNSELWLTEVTFAASGKITIRRDGGNEVYLGYSVTPIQASCVDVGFGTKIQSSNMLGDTNALLLTYLLKSSGEDCSVANLSKRIGKSALNNTNPVVTSFNMNQGISAGTDLYSFNINGDYFAPSGKTVTWGALPGSAEEEYFRYARSTKGSVVDLSSGTLSTNRALSSLGIYGERHWYWKHDEAAFLSGPIEGGQLYRHYDVRQNNVVTSDGPMIYNYHAWDQNVKYNALVTVPYQPVGFLMPREDEFSPLASYKALTDELYPTAGDPAGQMKDLNPNAWYYPAVTYAMANDLMQGTSDGVFSPRGVSTRAQIAAILYRLEGEPEVEVLEEEFPFTDVKFSRWYTNAIIWAHNNGIMLGYGNGRFGTMDPITREQLVSVLYRYSQHKGKIVTAKVDLSRYEDLDQVHRYALAPMQWANKNRLMLGRTETLLVPRDSVTRAESAAVLKRYLEDVA